MPSASPFELWQQAKGDPGTYRRLMREHGHLVGPGDAGYDPDAPRVLPCGWPGSRAADGEDGQPTEVNRG